MFKFPKNDGRFSWTTHIKNKMLFYGISQALINRIFRHPGRVEEGIAPDTVAAMQTRKKAVNQSSRRSEGGRDFARKKLASEEIWIMYKINSKGERSRVTMISAWRYPGVTKKGERPEIPEGVLLDLKKDGLI